MLTESQAKDICAQVVAASRADAVEVILSGESRQHLRYARNSVSTSGAGEDVVLEVRSTFGKRSGSAEINQLDPASLRRAVAAAEEIARITPEDPEHVGPLEPQTYPQVKAYRDGVLDDGGAALAAGVGTCLEAARRDNLVAAGFAQASGWFQCIANSKGLFGYHRQTDVRFSQTVRTPDGLGSGWASAVAGDVAGIDFASVAATSNDKAKRSLGPKALAPGSYVTILEPACVADLVALMLFSMQARTAEEGRSYFSKPGGATRVGEKLFGDAIHIESDPHSDVVPSLPWGAGAGWAGLRPSWLPQQRRAWIDGGKVATLARDREWAAKTGQPPVPMGANTLMRGGRGSVQDLIAGTKKGVLITSLWYIRELDPQTMSYTGLTRDGVFWIENGAISHPVTNFRWNDSPISVLKNVEAMSAPQRVSPRNFTLTTVAVPAVRVSGFALSSVSDAV